MQESHVALREQIARQEFSAEDVEQHLAERRRVKEALKKATEAKTKARKVRGTWYFCSLSVASNRKSRYSVIITFGLRLEERFLKPVFPVSVCSPGGMDSSGRSTKAQGDAGRSPRGLRDKG